MVLVTWVQVLDKAACISLRCNAFEKAWNRCILSSSYRWIIEPLASIWQTGLEEEKSEF